MQWSEKPSKQTALTFPKKLQKYNIRDQGWLLVLAIAHTNFNMEKFLICLPVGAALLLIQHLQSLDNIFGPGLSLQAQDFPSTNISSFVER